MKKYSFAPFLIFLVALSGCELAGDIFEAGAWTGIIIVIVIVALVLWLLGKLFGRK